MNKFIKVRAIGQGTDPASKSNEPYHDRVFNINLNRLIGAEHVGGKTTLFFDLETLKSIDIDPEGYSFRPQLEQDYDLLINTRD